MGESMKKISNWLDAINLKELETHLKQVIQEKTKKEIEFYSPVKINLSNGKPVILFGYSQLDYWRDGIYGIEEIYLDTLYILGEFGLSKIDATFLDGATPLVFDDCNFQELILEGYIRPDWATQEDRFWKKPTIREILENLDFLNQNDIQKIEDIMELELHCYDNLVTKNKWIKYVADKNSELAGNGLVGIIYYQNALEHLNDNENTSISQQKRLIEKFASQSSEFEEWSKNKETKRVNFENEENKKLIKNISSKILGYKSTDLTKN